MAWSLAMPTASSDRRPPLRFDVVDEVFASGGMITVARVMLLAVALLIIVACAYAVVSIVVRSTRGQWLQRAGGFEPELTTPSDRLGTIAHFADGLDDQRSVSKPAPDPHGKELQADDPRRATADLHRRD